MKAKLSYFKLTLIQTIQKVDRLIFTEKGNDQKIQIKKETYSITIKTGLITN